MVNVGTFIDCKYAKSVQQVRRKTLMLVTATGLISLAAQNFLNILPNDRILKLTKLKATACNTINLETKKKKKWNLFFEW